MNIIKYLDPKQSEPTKMSKNSNEKKIETCEIEPLKTWFIITIDSTLHQE